MSQFVRFGGSSSVAVVTLDRPAIHNAFDEVLIEELTVAFARVGGDPDVRCVVLAGAGKSFCAGADLRWMKRMVGYSFDENVADATAMARMLRAIHDCPKPVIARVQGAAFGGGVGLVAACDMAVAVRSAKFCLSEVKLGIIPAVISPYVLEKIGAAARRYALTAERFDGIEAKRIGLICEVVDSERALDAWIETVTAAIVASGPEAVSAAKAMMHEVVAFDWDGATDLTTRRIAERRVTDEGQEGMTAFLEKRPPRWTV